MYVKPVILVILHLPTHPAPTHTTLLYAQGCNSRPGLSWLSCWLASSCVQPMGGASKSCDVRGQRGRALSPYPLPALRLQSLHHPTAPLASPSLYFQLPLGSKNSFPCLRSPRSKVVSYQTAAGLWEPHQSLITPLTFPITL